MLRNLALAITTFALLLTGPLRADILPQGSFLLGTYIWSDKLLPRYVSLTIDGNTLSLDFSSPLPLDHDACDSEGDCIFRTRAATAQLLLQDQRIVLTEVDIDQNARIDPSAERHAGYPAHDIYTWPLVSMLQGALLSETPTGFRLDTGGLQLDFYRADQVAQNAAQAIPVVFELSIRRMAGCEVRSIAPLFLNPSPNVREQRFLNVLHGLVHQMALDQEGRRLTPYQGNPSPEQMARGRMVAMAMRLPAMMANFHPDPGSAFVEPFWDRVGKKAFKDDRAAYDTAIVGYGAGMSDLVEFYRHLRAINPEITAETVCADPSVGFEQ